MGCHQSKVEEQVVAPASNDLIVHSAVEGSAVTETPAVPAAPVSSVEEETAPQEEEAAAPVAATEEPAAAPAVEEETAAVVEEVAPVSTSNVESTEAQASETTEVVEVTEEVAPLEAVEEKEAPVAAVEEPQQEEEPVVAEKAEEQEPVAESSVSFKSNGVSFGEKNVVFYEFSLVDTENPAKEITIRKRFNDFKALHAEVAKLMANEANVPASQTGKFATYPALPALPKSGASSVLFGRRNQKLTAERATQFNTILNAIARHPIAYQSPAFQAFLA